MNIGDKPDYIDEGWGTRRETWAQSLAKRIAWLNRLATMFGVKIEKTKERGQIVELIPDNGFRKYICATEQHDITIGTASDSDMKISDTELRFRKREMQIRYNQDNQTITYFFPRESDNFANKPAVNLVEKDGLMQGVSKFTEIAVEPVFEEDSFVGFGATFARDILEQQGQYHVQITNLAIGTQFAIHHFIKGDQLGVEVKADKFK